LKRTSSRVAACCNCAPRMQQCSNSRPLPQAQRFLRAGPAEACTLVHQDSAGEPHIDIAN
jgi:hypothetical protein